MTPNALVSAAAADRHEPPYGYRCKACGSSVSSYNCNAALIAQRPKGAYEDWWMACDNADCVNAYGEEFFQILPDFVLRPEAT